MYIAMNRFHIRPGYEEKFEEIWRNRETFLQNVTGFKKFNLIKGESEADFTLYASHSSWASKEHFLNWTKSESFRDAHKNAGQNSEMYLAHPIFEGFKVVI